MFLNISDLSKSPTVVQYLQVNMHEIMLVADFCLEYSKSVTSCVATWTESLFCRNTSLDISLVYTSSMVLPGKITVEERSISFLGRRYFQDITFTTYIFSTAFFSSTMCGRAASD